MGFSDETHKICGERLNLSEKPELLRLQFQRLSICWTSWSSVIEGSLASRELQYVYRVEEVSDTFQ